MPIKVALMATLFLVAEVLQGQLTTCATVPGEGTAGAPIRFSACRSNVAWSFGDGGTASGLSITHTYEAGGVYTWTLQSDSGTAIETGHVSIVALPGGQCSFCPIDVPTAGDTTKLSAFGLCPDLTAFTMSFGNGITQEWPDLTGSPYCDAGAPTISPCIWAGTTYESPGVYTWSIDMTGKTGETCHRTGRITIIGCQVVKLNISMQDATVGGFVTLNWTTNNSIDCHPTGDVKTVSFEIDADNLEQDAVDDRTFTRTLPVIGLQPVGYHVFGVKPIVCRVCTICGGACFSLGPGYYLANNEQPITVLNDPNCAPITITAQPTNQTISNEGITLTASSSTAQTRFDWCHTTGGRNEDHSECDTQLSESGSSSYTARSGGFYWVVATSPCGRWARSDLVAVCTPPTISTQPQNMTAKLGQSVPLTAGAFGTELTFQWYTGSPQSPVPVDGGAVTKQSDYRDGVAYATSTLQTPPVTGNQSYFVRARDTCGSVVDSDVATVSLLKRRAARD